MDSKKLSARKKQPGHDRSFETSETNFVKALQDILPKEKYEVIAKPDDLRRMFNGEYGLVPEACLIYKPTGRRMYFEVKKQGPHGNAEERAAKHHTKQFYAKLAVHTKLDYHAYSTIFCDDLATLDRYVKKHPFFFEDGHYFLWADYDADSLRQYIEEITEKYLKGPIKASGP